MAGSLGLIRGGCFGYCCTHYSQRPLLLALNPSATAITSKIKRTPAPPPPVVSLSTFHDTISSIGTSAFWATVNTPNSGTLSGWKRCFCTEPSSSASAVADSDYDELTKIKETANTLDIRVGKILKAWRHEEADSLFVEEVDVGEPEPRIICSGLVNYVPLDHLQGINVVVLANLKPRNMRGVKSSGMLMAASDASHENVELLVPPEGSVPGQRIWFGSMDEKESLPDVASPNQIQKKKIWEMVQPHLRTDDFCTAALGEHTMRTNEGVVVCRSLKNARIS